MPDPIDLDASDNVNSVLAQTRERTVTSLLRLCAFFGIIPVALGTLASIQNRDWISLIVGNVALVAIFYLALNRQINYQIRAAVLVVITYIYLFFWSILSPNELFLAGTYAFVIMATLLLGRGPGITAFLLSMITIFTANWRITLGNTTLNSAMIPLTEPAWIVAGFYVELAFYIVLVLFTVMIFIDDFHVAWRREREAAQQAQIERDRLSDALKREHRLMEEVKLAYEREAAVSQLKTRIIQTVSHEFRTPMTVIQNSTDLILRYGNRVSAQQKESIEKRIQDSIFYLNDLLQDVVFVDSVNTDEINPDPRFIDGKTFIEKFKKEVHQETGEPNHLLIKVNQHSKNRILVDFSLIRQIAVNLVGNALKYSPGRLDIQVTVDINLDNLTIKVKDQGIGILPEDQPLIFDLFYRGANTVDRRGLGLGLFVVKRLVEAQNGTISVDSAPNQGTTFTVTIPTRVS